MANPTETLRTLLAPQGIKTVTTGGSEVGRFLQRRFGSTDDVVVRERWSAELQRIERARALVVGVPMDAGAGFERGSFKGPLALRTALLEAGLWERMSDAGVVDLGDVRVNPHLVDDSYYTADLLERVRRARDRDDDLPVAPHSALRAVLRACHELAPETPVLVLGGDHSISRIPVEVLAERFPDTLGVFHVDAHTDLLDERDGTPHNFATWAYHANDAIGRGRRMVQLGIRVSGRSRDAWETELDLRQIRMEEAEVATPEELADEVSQILRDAGVRQVYVSNDIDGTDPTYAASTGTMEPGGLHPDLVIHVLRRLGADFDVVGSDLVEVAPPLKWHVPGEPARTIRTGARYVLEQLDAMIGTNLAPSLSLPEPADPGQVARAPGFV